MKYATWKLNFDNPDYGTGPEEKIAELGAKAEAGWAEGAVESGSTILGYVTGEVDAADLSDWSFEFLTEAQALAFCNFLNADAYLLDDGRIGLPYEDLEIDTATAS